MICHGSYDTIAFIRFANRKSKYPTLTWLKTKQGKQAFMPVTLFS